MQFCSPFIFQRLSLTDLSARTTLFMSIFLLFYLDGKMGPCKNEISFVYVFGLNRHVFYTIG